MVGGRGRGKSADEPRVRDIIPDFVAITRRHECRVTLFIIPRDKHICASLPYRAGSTLATAVSCPAYFLDERILPSTLPLFNVQLADASPVHASYAHIMVSEIAAFIAAYNFIRFRKSLA